MPLVRATLALLALLSAATTARAADPWFDDQSPQLLALYKHLHTHPELSFHEEQTSRRVAEELRKSGAEVTTGIGKYGVVGVLKNGAGSTVLVRSDLDALPVTEDTGLSYASKVVTTSDEGKSVGVMHACGHDVHMTCLVGVARWLADHKDRWSGTVLLVGQPAEELVSGAKAMLDDKLYDRFGKPDYALALHVTHDLPTGDVGFTVGPALASSTSVNVTIRGKGGHGAQPHATVDPIVLSALVILDLQTIVSREVDPLQPSVVTVGSVIGGTKHNIIPDAVELQLTLRAYREDVRNLLIDGIQRRIKGLASAHRAPEPGFEVLHTTPPTINTPALVERIVPALRKELGEAHVSHFDPVMGAEDFGLFSRGGEIPLFMFRLGAVAPDRVKAARASGERLPSLHSAKFAPEPAGAITSGIRAMSAAVVELMVKK